LVGVYVTVVVLTLSLFSADLELPEDGTAVQNHVEAFLGIY
jgi:hypothetical protein